MYGEVCAVLLCEARQAGQAWLDQYDDQRLGGLEARTGAPLHQLSLVTREERERVSKVWARLCCAGDDWSGLGISGTDNRAVCGHRCHRVLCLLSLPPSLQPTIRF